MKPETFRDFLNREATILKTAMDRTLVARIQKQHWFDTVCRMDKSKKWPRATRRNP